jgi:signal transduction histidine kinase
MTSILIVDDEEGLRTSLVIAFEREGYQAEGAASAEEAMARLGRGPVDILLTDLVMPGMDGVSLMEGAQRSCPGILTILMTGGGTVESAIRALKAGAYDYILKPFTFVEMFHVVRRGIEQQRLRQENVQLSELNRRLSELDALKSNLLSAITHEFRTPLTLMHGWLDMLLAEQLGAFSAQQRESLRAVQRGAGRLSRLVNNLLAFVEYERGVARPCFPVNLAELIAQAAEHLGPDCAERGVAVFVEAPPDLPPLPADGERLLLVLVNLMENAVKFNEPGGEVRVRAVRADGAQVVTVTNTRGELPPERMIRLFQPFTQGDMSATRAAGGLGLGLAVARAVVEAHGGEIALDAAPGQGTSVRVRLPERPVAVAGAGA